MALHGKQESLSATEIFFLPIVFPFAVVLWLVMLIGGILILLAYGVLWCVWRMITIPFRKEAAGVS